jgi:hypothetical protein
MIEIALAGCVSLVAGFFLRIGAFLIFAVLVGVVYFAMNFLDRPLGEAALSLLLLFLVMQFSYIVGVLLPSPLARAHSSSRLSLVDLQRRILSLLKNVG